MTAPEIVRYDGRPRLKPAILGLPFLGKYKPEVLPDDVAALKQYYHSLGYFDVEIDKDVKIDESPLNPLSFHSAHAIITHPLPRAQAPSERESEAFNWQ